MEYSDSQILQSGRSSEWSDWRDVWKVSTISSRRLLLRQMEVFRTLKCSALDIIRLDGTGIRDYIHITDLANGQCYAAKSFIVS